MRNVILYSGVLSSVVQTSDEHRVSFRTLPLSRRLWFCLWFSYLFIYLFESGRKAHKTPKTADTHAHNKKTRQRDKITLTHVNSTQHNWLLTSTPGRVVVSCVFAVCILWDIMLFDLSDDILRLSGSCFRVWSVLAGQSDCYWHVLLCGT